MDLVNYIFTLTKQLTASIGQLKKNGSEYAEAERDYKVLMAQTALQLRADNTPVTFINLIIHGDKKVAELRMKRDIAKVIYETNIEHINAVKLQIRLLDNQVAREWTDTKNKL